MEAGKNRMYIVCADMEGIFTPEIWINVAERTGIMELRLTTRDISDYDELMTKRLGILDQHGLKLQDIQAVISKMEPLDGALDFLSWLRSQLQLIIVSDTYEEFAGPLLKKMGWPTLFCNTLSVAANGSISGYNLRQNDGKMKVAIALQNLNYKVIAIGDSYNDITMLRAADKAILFRPPENVEAEFPQFAVTTTYAEIQREIQKIINAS
jgi:phosphoserine/homoserine phosphotransferase